MGARNWTICPKCWKDAKDPELQPADKQAEMEADIAAFTAKYGEQRGKQYRIIMLSTLEPMESENTMREDWELGIDAEGVFYLKYTAYCTKCSWKYEKRIQEKVA